MAITIDFMRSIVRFAALVAVLGCSLGMSLWGESCRNVHFYCPKCNEPGAKEEVPQGTKCCDGSFAKSGSWIDSIGFDHHHEAMDYVAENTGTRSGCSSCGGARWLEGTGGLPSLGIKRVHRYRFAAYPSAFGPGAFTTFDDHLELNITDAATGSGAILYFRVDGVGRVTLYDANTLHADPIDGVYHDPGFGTISELRLFDAAGAPVVDQKLAATAVLRDHDGSRQVYEVINLSGDPNGSQRWGRLIRREDRNGNAIVIAYAFPRDASPAVLGGSRTRLWQMATITDAYGRIARVAYAATQVAGRWVVSRIDLPNGAAVTYGYDAEGLARVVFPDGAITTITRSADTVEQQTVIHYDEAAAEGIHRRKDASMSNATFVRPDGTVINQSSGLIRRIVNGAGEVAYWNQEAPDDPQVIYVYEGGTMLRRLTTSAFDYAIKSEVAINWTFGQPLTGLVFETTESYGTNAQARITQSADALGRRTAYEVDGRNSAVTKVTYPDLTIGTATYNDFAEQLHVVDRLGRITDQAYDTNGNRVSRTVAVGTPAQATWSWSYNGRGQVLQARDADFDPAAPDLHVTDYVYDAAGFLVGIVEAADVAGGARPLRQFAYDTAGRLVKTTDPDGRTADYTYDQRNRVVKIAYGGNVGITADFETFTYGTASPDANLLLEQRDRNGNRTVNGYDLAGRLTATTWAAGTPEAGSKSCTYLTGTDLLAGCVELGDQTTYTYDYRLRRVATARQANTGKILTARVAFDNVRRIASQQDEYGRTTYPVYDINDREIRTVKELVPGQVPAGTDLATLARVVAPNPPYVITDVTYDAVGQRLTMTDGRGIRSDTAYDAQGRVIAQIQAAAAPAPTPALSLTTTFTYDPQGNRIRVTLPRTLTEGSTFATAFTYSGRNLLLSTTEAVGRSEQATRSATYTRTGKRATDTDPRGNTTTFTYYPCCDRLKDVIDPTGATTTTVYDFYGNIVSVTDPNGNTTTTQYDGRLRVTAITNAEGETTRYAYDDNGADAGGLSGADPAHFAGLHLGVGSDGSAILTTNPLGETMLQIRDGLGRPVRTVDGNGNAITTNYDAVVSGLVETAIADAGGHVTRMRADGARLVRAQDDAEGRATTMRYDGDGNRVGMRDPNGVGKDWVFDAANRDVQDTDTVGAITRRAYDEHGNVVVTTDALLKTTSYVFDGRDRKIRSTDRIAGVTTFTFDGTSNLTSITDAEGAVTAYAYDQRNLLVIETYPPGQVTPSPGQDRRSYTYDPGRRLRSRTDQSGLVTRYDYDRANRLISRGYPDGLNDAFAYDHAGRLTSATSARFATTVARGYDPGGRLAHETQTVLGVSYPVDYGYDADNLVTRVTHPDGRQVTRTYTARHQLASVAFDGALVATRSYDPGMRLASTISGNGLVETRTYNADDTVARIVVPGVTDFTYAYDVDKRKTAEGHLVPAEAQAFGYDAEGRVTTWQRDGQESQNWTLTTVGDWAATTRTGASAFSQTRIHSSVHETTGIIQSGVVTPLLYDTKGNLLQDQAGQQYHWDPENRLVAAVVGAATSGYRYDALGRRLAKIAGGIATTFVHDGARVIAEYDAPFLQSQAIGAPALVGSFSDDGQGTITLAAGGTDIGGTADQFRYAYATLVGDGTITARVVTQANTDPSAKAGLMLREGLAADARNAAVFITPGAGAVFQRRLAPGGSTVITATGTGTAMVPQWLRLVRSGSLTTAYRSTDGLVWTAIGSESVPFAAGAPISVGVAVASHNPSVLGTITFTSLVVGGSSGPAVVPMSTRVCVYGAYVDEVLGYTYATNGGLAARYYVHSNHLYSPAGLTDSTGAVVERYTYTAYGKQTVTAGIGGTVRAKSSVGWDRGFTGYIADNENGLLYARYRMYSLTLGGFVSRDPFTSRSRNGIGYPTAQMGYHDGMSQYGAYFVPGKTDSSGLLTCCKTVMWTNPDEGGFSDLYACSNNWNSNHSNTASVEMALGAVAAGLLTGGNGYAMTAGGVAGLAVYGASACTPYCAEYVAPIVLTQTYLSFPCFWNKWKDTREVCPTGSSPW